MKSTDSSAYSGVTFFRYYFKDGRTVEIGGIPFFYGSGRNNAVWTGRSLYYSCVGGENAECERSLYEIDLVSNKLVPVSQDAPALSIYNYKNMILSADDGTIRLFDADTGKYTAESAVFSGDRKSRTGGFIGDICVSGEHIYALIAEEVSSGAQPGGAVSIEGYSVEYKCINVYDGELNLARVIELDGVREQFADSVGDSSGAKMFGSMSVFGDFIFISDNKGRGYLWTVEDDEAAPLFTEEWLRAASGFGLAEPPMLFALNSDRIFIIDAVERGVKEIELDLKKGAVIGDIRMTDTASLIYLSEHDPKIGGYKQYRVYVTDNGDFVKSRRFGLATQAFRQKPSLRFGLLTRCWRKELA